MNMIVSHARNNIRIMQIVDNEKSSLGEGECPTVEKPRFHANNIYQLN